MQNPNPFGTTRPVVKACPVCGSTALSIEVLVSAVQNNNGNWSIVADPEDLNNEFTDPNIAVRCLNEYCGPIIYNGQVYEFQNDMDLFLFWLVNFCAEERETIEQFQRAYLAGELKPIDIPAYVEFESEVVHHPWSGHVNDLMVLNM